MLVSFVLLVWLLVDSSMLLCCLCFIASLHVLLYIILEVSCVQYTSYVCTVHEQLVLLAQVVKGAPAAAATSRSRRTQLVLTVWLLLGWFPLLVVISRIGLFDCCSLLLGEQHSFHLNTRSSCMDADLPRPHRGVRSGAAAKRRRTAHARNVSE